MNLIDFNYLILIKQANFDSFLNNISSTLTITDPMYAGTFILANILAYISIIVFAYFLIDVLLFLFKRLKKVFR